MTARDRSTEFKQLHLPPLLTALRLANVPPDTARQVADTYLLQLCRDNGGRRVYIPQAQYKKDNLQRILQLRAEGNGVAQISGRLGISGSYVYRMLRDHDAKRDGANDAPVRIGKRLGRENEFQQRRTPGHANRRRRR